MSYFYNYWFGETDKEIIVSDKDKQNKYQVLKEIKSFDKSILLPTYKPVIEVKQKITKYKKTKRVKARKK